MNEDGTPKVFYHGSKKNGGFTVFRDWQYFTEQKRYAERYAERGNQKSLYEVYLTADKVFDTRDEDAARIFESILQEYGLTALQDTGLPDWTDGYDITEYLSEHPELGYDAVLLDEGGDLVNGEPVGRGLSIVIKDSSQVKSATDNLGTFDRNNKDIRFSFDDEDYMLTVEAGDMDAAQQEAKYLSLAEKYRNGTATLLETIQIQEMVDEAAKKAGFTYRRNSRNVLDPVNGTPWTMYGDSRIYGFEKFSTYGENGYAATDRGAISIDDIMDDVKQLAEDFYGMPISEEDIDPPDVEMTEGV